MRNQEFEGHEKVQTIDLLSLVNARSCRNASLGYVTICHRYENHDLKYLLDYTGTQGGITQSQMFPQYVSRVDPPRC